MVKEFAIVACCFLVAMLLMYISISIDKGFEQDKRLQESHTMYCGGIAATNSGILKSIDRIDRRLYKAGLLLNK